MNNKKRLNKGDLLKNRYAIQREIAKGGMGVTYLAFDNITQKNVVVKSLTFSELKEWKVYELFEREVQTLQNIDHPNIPDYIDNFKYEQNYETHFICVQEYVKGENIEQAINENKRKFSIERVINIFKDLLEILKYIHNVQPSIIHRDINPHNIILGNNGKVYLVDFNASGRIAKSTMAASGTFVGTFGYMAQEQLYGKAYPATDLYALAITVIYMLTGKQPSEFPLKKMKLNYKDYVNIPSYLEYLLDLMLEPDVNKRIQSAEECLKILERKTVTASIDKNKKEQAAGLSNVSKLKKIKRYTVISGIVALFTLVVIFVLLFMEESGNQSQESASTVSRERIRIKELPPIKVDKNRLLSYKDTNIETIAVSKDSTLVAAGGSADVILVWNIQTGKLVHKLVAHRRDIQKLLFSPDNSKLVSFGEDKNLIIWNLKTGKVIKNFSIKRAYSKPVAFSPDFKHVAHFNYSSEMVIHNLSSGNVINSFKIPFSFSGNLTYSKDGNFLAYKTFVKRIYRIVVLNLKTRKYKLLPNKELDYNSRIIFFNDNKHVCLLKKNKSLLLFDYHKNEISRKLIQIKAKYSFRSYDISPDKKILAYNQFSGVIIQHIPSKKILTRFTIKFNYKFINSIKFSNDNKYVFAASGKHGLRVFTVNNGKLFKTLLPSY